MITKLAVGVKARVLPAGAQVSLFDVGDVVEAVELDLSDGMWEVKRTTGEPHGAQWLDCPSHPRDLYDLEIIQPEN